MSRIGSKHVPYKNPLPLFVWADARNRRPDPIPYPAAWLRRRFPGMTLSTSVAVAELAGLSGGLCDDR